MSMREILEKQRAKNKEEREQKRKSAAKAFSLLERNLRRSNLHFYETRKDIFDAGVCSLEVEVGTTGRCNGDSGHGGETYIRLKNISSFVLHVNKVSDGEVELLFGGDAEYEQIRSALSFVSQCLDNPTRIVEQAEVSVS
jgi:hypothetical protein